MSTELEERILIKGQQWLLKTESKGVCLKNLMWYSAMRCFEKPGKGMNFTYFWL